MVCRTEFGNIPLLNRTLALRFGRASNSKRFSITQYCDQHRLSTQQRLQLFNEVCTAIHHARQKGIIHRDIKPTNVLVTTDADRPLPKVIDFGIAKATQGRLTDKTVFTHFQHLIGTPAYMSPEQADSSAVDVDTRSDIYSLGVLLYELLTGFVPFNSEKLQDAGFDEIRRRIREDEPPKPSTRISRMTNAERTTVTLINLDDGTARQPLTDLACGLMHDVQLIDVPSQKIVATFGGLAGQVEGMCFSPNGTNLIVSCLSGIVRVFNLKVMNAVGDVLVTPSGYLGSVEFLGDGSQVLVADPVAGVRVLQGAATVR